ncbi:MAG: hypothetical protein AMJ73_05550 [candidate division Zixibacteria bacterium SM1_73]|nr:MAG: hypothetical protein AMJ73_05550 [candidate division Zixibacteria bacterium SM1_73]
MGARLILIIVIVGLFIVFMLQNDDPLKVKFIFWSVVMSKSLLILLVFVTGLIFGWITLARGQRRRDSVRGKKQR